MELNPISWTNCNPFKIVLHSCSCGNVVSPTSTTCIRRHHCLRIRERFIFKICLLVHKCLNGNAPSSLSSLWTNCSSSRTMKLANRTYRSGFDDRSFSRVGPKLWKLLPIHLRMEEKSNNFKTGLKTYLFDKLCQFRPEIA